MNRTARLVCAFFAEARFAAAPGGGPGTRPSSNNNSSELPTIPSLSPPQTISDKQATPTSGIAKLLT